jgi:GR25 family glycosyltransferase involved in LPS biosynthesis
MLLNKIGVVVIANNEKIRNYHQINDEFFKKFSKAHIFRALTPSVLGCDNIDNSHSHTKSLTCNEFAASLSHQAARNFSVVFELEWILFLEDDAILSDDFFPTLENLMTLEGFADKKASFHLFPEQFGLLKTAKDKLYRIIILPDYAVGYLMNQKAIKFTLSNTHYAQNSLADWPGYIKQIEWFAPNRSIITHPKIDDEYSDELSSIEKLRQLKQDTYSLCDKLFSKELIRKIFLVFLKPFTKPYGNSVIKAPLLRTRYYR